MFSALSRRFWLVDRCPMSKILMDQILTFSLKSETSFVKKAFLG